MRCKAGADRAEDWVIEHDRTTAQPSQSRSLGIISVLVLVLTLAALSSIRRKGRKGSWLWLKHPLKVSNEALEVRLGCVRLDLSTCEHKKFAQRTPTHQLLQLMRSLSAHCHSAGLDTQQDPFAFRRFRSVFANTKHMKGGENRTDGCYFLLSKIAPHSCVLPSLSPAVGALRSTSDISRLNSNGEHTGHVCRQNGRREGRL